LSVLECILSLLTLFLIVSDEFSLSDLSIRFLKGETDSTVKKEGEEEEDEEGEEEEDEEGEEEEKEGGVEEGSEEEGSEEEGEISDLKEDEVGGSPLNSLKSRE
jgi:hypothetical protein